MHSLGMRLSYAWHCTCAHITIKDLRLRTTFILFCSFLFTGDGSAIEISAPDFSDIPEDLSIENFLYRSASYTWRNRRRDRKNDNWCTISWIHPHDEPAHALRSNLGNSKNAVIWSPHFKVREDRDAMNMNMDAWNINSLFSVYNHVHMLFWWCRYSFHKWSYTCSATMT